MTSQSSTPPRQSGKPSVWGRIVRYVLPLAISVGLCYVLFHDMSFGEMVEFVRSDCDFSWIFLSMAIGLAGFLFRAMRWRIQLRAAGITPPLMPVVYSIVGTYAVNLVLPRLGELWRSEYISRRQKAPFATVFGSMVAERAADTLTVMLLFIVTFLLSGSVLKSFIDDKMGPDNSVYRILSSPWTYAVAAGGCIVVGMLAWRFRRNPLMGKIRRLWQELVGGFCSIFHMKGGRIWLLLTLLLWGSYFVQMWACFSAFGTTRRFMEADGIIIVLVCFVLGSISMGIPSNGGIGPYQIALVFGLQCFVPDLNQQEGFSFANVVLGAQTLLTIVCGLISFAAIAIDNRRLSEKG